MSVAFVHDPASYLGGAELTMREFETAAPEPLVPLDEADTVVVGNCTSFDGSLILEILSKRVLWFHHDLSPHIQPGLQAWLNENAEHIFCSPLQAERYGLDGKVVPPAIDLDRFRQAQNGSRDGAVAVGSWQNPGKGQQQLAEWAQDNGPVDVYGGGPYVPSGGPLVFKGELVPEDVPEVLARYRTFVHLPTAVEPFGRCVVEAWASGCELIVNRLVGARWWLENDPDAIATAADDFWKVVLND